MPKLPRDFQVFLGAVSLFAAVLVWLELPSPLGGRWPELLLFFILISLVSMFPIPDPRGGYITAASALFYVLIMTHGPGPAIIVAGPAYAIGAAVSRRWLPWRSIFNGAQMGVSVWLAGVSFVLAGGTIGQIEINDLVIPLAVAILVHQAANNFFVSFYFSRLRHTPLLPTWIGDIRGLILSNMLSIPIALLLAYIYVTIHPLTLLLYLVSLPFQRRAHQLQIRQKQTFDQAIDSLVVAIDAGFPQGAGHSRRVADTAVIVARHLGLPDTQVDVIELGALLHDVGLLGLDEFLGGEDDDRVAEKLKEHVAIGADISRELPQKGITQIVLYHHEHFDGSGFPEGLMGRQIPIGARVVALAEAFESMRAGGFPYGHPRSLAEASAAIITQSGRSFDPVIVNAFVAALESGAVSDYEARQIPSSATLSEEGGTA